MGDKKHGPLHSQVLGIVWISVGLLLVLGVAFFSLHRGGADTQTAVVSDSVSTVLASKEDSVYRSRKKSAYYQKDKPFYGPRKAVVTDTQSYTRQEPAYHRQPLSVELNTADTTTLMLLSGIGPTFASRIVRYRERLGGFVAKEQLLEVYGFTPELFGRIAPYLTVDADDVRRFSLDTIGLKQLVKHPYIEYYQARDLIRLRDRGQHFRSEDDLRALPSMTDSTLQRLLPYLVFDL